jgi:DNA-directed RNA polymerase specialized sigma24 family protein
MRKQYLQLAQWSDTELIAAVESFNVAAYSELQERHSAAARTFAAQLSADRADVDAIVAGTFAQLHDVLLKAAGPKVALRPYLFTTVRWAAHDHLGSGRATAADAAELPADAAELPAHTAELRAGAGPTTDPAGPGADPTQPEDAPQPADAAGPSAGAAQAEAVQPPAEAVQPLAEAVQPPAEAVQPPANAPELGAVAAEARTEQPTGADDDGPAQQQAPDLGEALFTDPAIADLVRSPLYRAFRSLPERFQAVLWHTDIEQTHPALTATILGLSLDGVADLADEAREGLRQACLDQHLSDVTREDCSAALTALGDGADDGQATQYSALMAQQHLADCADCRAAATEIADLRESLRRVVAPVFLGVAAAAYLSAAKASATDASLGEADAFVAGLGVGGLRWTRQQPSRGRRSARPPGVLIAAAAVLCVLALTGLALAAVSSTAARQSPPGSGQRAAAAVPTAPAPPGSASATPSPTPASQALVSPGPQATTPAATPTPTTPAPTTPVPTTPVPTTPAPTATPCPTLKHCRLRPCPCPTPPPPF